MIWTDNFRTASFPKESTEWLLSFLGRARGEDLLNRRGVLRQIELESYAAIGREVVAELLSTPPVRLVGRERVVVDLATLAERHGASDE